jgi:hypothetical protein
MWRGPHKIVVFHSKQVQYVQALQNVNGQAIQTIAYYGVLSEIIVLDYHNFQIPLFKCDWVSTDHGVKVVDGFTLVNLHQFQNEFESDPFILASQASQVFYSRESQSSSWYTVLRAPPRGFHELDMYDEDNETSCKPLDVSMLDNAIDDHDVSYIRQGCDGILVKFAISLYIFLLQLVSNYFFNEQDFLL